MTPAQKVCITFIFKFPTIKLIKIQNKKLRSPFMFLYWVGAVAAIFFSEPNTNDADSQRCPLGDFAA
jgi:hypothetical protein